MSVQGALLSMHVQSYGSAIRLLDQQPIYGSFRRRIVFQHNRANPTQCDVAHLIKITSRTPLRTIRLVDQSYDVDFAQRVGYLTVQESNGWFEYKFRRTKRTAHFTSIEITGQDANIEAFAFFNHLVYSGHDRQTLNSGIKDETLQHVRLMACQAGINRYNLNITGLITGFFLDNVDLEMLTHLELNINHTQLIQYTADDLVHFTQQLDGCVYVSINGRDFLPDNQQTWEWDGSLNTSRIEQMQLSIGLTNAQPHITVRAFVPNIMRVIGGVIGHAYAISGWNRDVPRINDVPPVPVAPSDLAPSSPQKRARKIPETVCPVTQEVIGAEYMKCATCQNVFDREAIETWLQNHTSCPTCRSEFTDRTVYENIEQAEAD